MAEFRFGIEEEYFVVDRRTASVKVRVSRPFMAAAKRKLGPSLMYELLQSQIEVATTPIESSQDARQQLKYFRSTLAEIGRDHNIGIVAAGTHPFNLSPEQKKTLKNRNTKGAAGLGMVALGTPPLRLHLVVEGPAPPPKNQKNQRLPPL